MSRRMIAPGVWIVEEGRRIPESEGAGAVQVAIVGSMRPVMTGGVYFEASKQNGKVALSITGKPKP